MATDTTNTPARTLRRTDSIGLKVGRMLFFVGSLAAIATALMSYILARGTLEGDALSRLRATRTVMGDSVEGYFASKRNDLSSMAESQTVLNALRDFSQARRDLEADLASQGQPATDESLAPIRREVGRYYENYLVLKLREIREGTVPSVLTFLHASPAANLLQYMYTVKNDARIGGKDQGATAAEMATYSGVEPAFATAFTQTSYVRFHDIYHPILNTHRTRSGLYDLFVVDRDGYVVYSSAKELDFQGDLKDGPQSNTGLGEAFAKAISADPAAREVFVTDLAPYAVSYDAPCAFLSTAIVGQEGTVAGALIYQVTGDALNELMNFKGQRDAINLGETGEAYLIASQGGTPVMRSDSRFISASLDAQDAVETTRFIRQGGELTTARTTIGEQPVTAGGAPTTGAARALEGQTGDAAYTNYLGETVLSAFAKLDIPGLDWAVLVEQSTEEAFAPARRIALAIILVSVLVLLLVAALAIYVARGIARPIQSLENAMNQVAAGNEDVRAEVVGQDEIATLASTFNRLNADRFTAQKRMQSDNERLQNNIEDLLLVVADASDGKLGVRARVTEGALGNIASALNIMLENVGDFIEQIRKASSRVASASVEIATSAGDLTRGVTQQTDELQSSVSELQELAKGSRQVSATSIEANEAARQTRAAAEQGQDAVSQVQYNMEQIREKVQVNAQKIKRLGERSMEISGIVKSISDISAQTDMLAFNASVESERGGEGRGFNLVADRVRDLAERTKQATMEIERLVAGIQSETAEAVVQMERMTQEVENGSSKVGAAADALQNIVKSSIRSSELVADISQIAKVQDEEAQHILAAVTNVNHIVERARSKVLESRRTSEQLAELSSDLNERISVFDTTGMSQA